MNQTDKDMREYAIEGLRCLIIAFAVIKEKDYRKWSEGYRRVCADISQIEKKKRGEVRVDDALLVEISFSPLYALSLFMHAGQ